jgi:hypothetical protein
VQRREFGQSDPVASSLLACVSMVELLLLAAAVIMIVVFANDDDLPGPRRCFAQAAGAR